MLKCFKPSVVDEVAMARTSILFTSSHPSVLAAGFVEMSFNSSVFFCHVMCISNYKIRIAIKGC